VMNLKQIFNQIFRTDQENKVPKMYEKIFQNEIVTENKRLKFDQFFLENFFFDLKYVDCEKFRPTVIPQREQILFNFEVNEIFESEKNFRNNFFKFVLFLKQRLCPVISDEEITAIWTSCNFTPISRKKKTAKIASSLKIFDSINFMSFILSLQELSHQMILQQI
jgi:hypothetical protein